MRIYLALAMIAAVLVPVTAVAAPIHIRLVGEVGWSYTRSGFELPSFVGEQATASIDLIFEPVVLTQRGITSDVQVPVFEIIGSYPIAGSSRIELVEGYITLASERLQMTDGNLLVSDNRMGGCCAGFFCSTWQDDAIEVLGYGDALALGDNVHFSTSGGLVSQASGFNIPSTLEVGTDLADLATWNSFSGGSFYIRFSSEDGNNLGSTEILLTEVIAIPEPLSSTLLLVSIALVSIRGLRRVPLLAC